MTDCKHADKCWLGGRYEYCKTATCDEPMVRKERLIKQTGEIPKGLPTARLEEKSIDNMMQGELF